METIQEKLKEHNFIKKDSGEFVKGSWTVRFDKEILEAFNNPDEESGVYYSAPLHKIDLDILLDEINDKIEKE